MKKLGFVFVLLLFFLPGYAQKNYVSTFAGGVKQGDLGGPIEFARFSFPWDLAVTLSGNILVADAVNCKIKLIDLIDLAVVDYAGSGDCGFLNGPKEVAQFNYPYWLGVDPMGNVYVVDLNNVMRKIDTTGNVTTFLATGNHGFKNGYKDSVEFAYMTDFIIDSIGNFYIGDAHNSRIRKLDTAGMVTTFTGGGPYYDENEPWPEALVDGNKDQARFASPFSLDMDNHGNLYVADFLNHAIRKVDSFGNVTTLVGTVGPSGKGIRGYKDGPISEGKLNHPGALLFDENHGILILDFDNSRIRQIKDDSIKTIVGGNPGNKDGEGLQARIESHHGAIIRHPILKNTFIFTDGGNHAVKFLRMDSVGEFTLVKPISNSNLVKVFPNPTTDEINMDFASPFVKSKWELIDGSGKNLMKGTLSGLSHKISTNHIPSGRYYLKISNLPLIPIIKN